MNQNQIPLYTGLIKHKENNPISFHVPGHKYGQLFPKEAKTTFENMLKIDVTELTGLDNLHHTEGIISEAEKLTADLYEVERSFFLVNGSTVGNLAMILAVCSENDVVLVQRNSHKSIINALQLVGVKPVFLAPEYDHQVKVASCLLLDTVKLALERFPNAKAVILTNPNYYGMSVDISEIVIEAHVKNIPVLVDEAHGAHFILEDFPRSAVQANADVVVHSAHKTLPAMTMGSFLHVNSKLVDVSRIAYYLQVLQSSSPSYPIMASLDVARFYLSKMKVQGGTKDILEGVQAFKEELSGISQINVVESGVKQISTDPLKVTIQSNTELNGFELQSLLEENGVFAEMADPHNVLLVLPLSSNIREMRRLGILIGTLFKTIPNIKSSSFTVLLEDEKISGLALSYQEIKRYNKKAVLFEAAIGEISAEMVIPYPPGIPLVMTGERITKRQVELLKYYIQAGTRFQGHQFKEDKILVFK
ncbi:aminotransferase class I/II-fold pyridoxal phosphate-dependent enzyme [Litchfieldia alkalitelluris]|uniref:aminotransferase class I/II-fold pyridoxal phosphate-dependent enzyme n=1 Tax=Litchfieldia alkalitelluris TaxID=304268 RepID=UPI000997DAEB|nr:aminotransferase class I/II-fold pyridoxal phosphate-dependent enzyme [Litchfieldia alkalitelluris]